jgi:uncharacterized membrane protein
MEMIIIAVTFAIGCILPVLVVLYIIRMLIRNKQENQRLRLEVGKLADEVERMRKRGDITSAAQPQQ